MRGWFAHRDAGRPGALGDELPGLPRIAADRACRVARRRRALTSRPAAGIRASPAAVPQAPRRGQGSGPAAVKGAIIMADTRTVQVQTETRGAVPEGAPASNHRPVVATFNLAVR